MSKDNVKIGSLIRYSGMNGEDTYGLVTKHIKDPKEISEALGERFAEELHPAVQVLWVDDGDFTMESIKNLRDPDVEYMEVISEK